MSRDRRLYLEDMIECCQRVMEYTSGLSLEQLLADRRTFDAVQRNLEIVGEAAKHIPAELRARYPSVEWYSPLG